ncbi:unnamed protein product, partial [Polarella glacialis]
VSGAAGGAEGGAQKETAPQRAGRPQSRGRFSGFGRSAVAPTKGGSLSLPLSLSA